MTAWGLNRKAGGKSMKNQRTRRAQLIFVLLFITAIVILGQSLQAQDDQSPKTQFPGPSIVKMDSPDAQPFRASAMEFTQAFNRGDASGIAALLTPDCDYDDEAGNIYHGRQQIMKEYADFFSRNPGAKMEIHIDSIRQISPDAAIEDGTATVMLPKGPSSASQYLVVHV
jgi:uncharacterized protein (TIGR02246 family)